MVYELARAQSKVVLHDNRDIYGTSKPLVAITFPAGFHLPRPGNHRLGFADSR